MQHSGCQHLDFGLYEWSPRLCFPDESSRASFNSGLVQLWGFNHEDSSAHFGDCLAKLSSAPSSEHVPSLKVLCLVLSAFCLSPNYNNPQGLSMEKAAELVTSAQKIAEEAKLSGWVADLLAAAVARTLPVDAETATRTVAYAEAMSKLVDKYPDLPPDVQILHCEALMNKRPWALWPKFKEYREAREKGNPPPAVHPETQALEKKLCHSLHETSWGRTHPGLLHLSIHFWELSPTPENGIIASDLLENLCPDQGHLQHMPSHIHMWMGMYQEAIDANVLAVRADDRFVHLSGKGGCFYTFYRMHNIHFVVWAAMHAAQESLAMEYALRIEQDAGQTFLNAETACYLEAYAPLPWYVLIRFGRWQEILDRPIASGPHLLLSTATAYYAKGMAAASLGQVKEAEEFEEKFKECLKNEDIQGYANRSLHNNPGYLTPEQSKQNPNMTVGMMNVGESVLRGEILYRKGAFSDAFAELRRAVDLDDSLVYDEPWGWLIPSRHALGALLAEQGHLDEAISVFEEDLQKMPGNIWGLVGLRDTLRKRGKQRDLDRADIISREVMLRGRGKGVKIPVASCACAVVAGAVAPLCCGK